MRKVDSLPLETVNNLGADSVWLGTLDLVIRKMDFRIRVYSKPPFATAKAPSMLFDSLTQNAVGIPAQVSVGENGSTTFEMKAIGAKFVATLNEAGNQLDGRFIQGPLPLPLVMKLLTDDTSKAKVATSRRKVIEERSDLFQERKTLAPPEKTGLPDEYNSIEETISPTALSTIPRLRIGLRIIPASALPLKVSAIWLPPNG